MKTGTLILNYTLEDIDVAVKRFWEATSDFYLFAFSGEMGAGKTTFIHRLCDYLQVEDNVSSPTFALVNEYHFYDINKEDKLIYHLDWYRLKNEEEAINAGMQDCIDQAAKGKAYCFVEWPEKAHRLLQHPYLWIDIETKTPLLREMAVQIKN